MAEIDSVQNRVDDSSCDTVLHGNVVDRMNGEKSFADVQEETGRHAELRMDPWEMFIEAASTLLAEIAPMVESEHSSSARNSDVANCLGTSGILDDAVRGTTVRAEPFRRFRDSEKQLKAVGVGHDFVDPDFIW